jgi:amino acid transporter
VLTSASSSTQTTILPTARTTLSMGAYKAIPTRFARVHPRYLTPTDSTIWMGGVSIVFYVGMTLVSTNILGDSIAAVGLMIAFYYGLTGFACAWFYRKTLTSNFRDLVMRGIIPVTGGVLLLGAFGDACYQYAQPDYGSTKFFGIGGVFVIGIGALLFGVVLMYIWQAMSPSYFREETLPRRADLVMAPGAGSIPHLGLPDSGAMPTVISPDLSNLPPGQAAIDPETGEEFRRD